MTEARERILFLTGSLAERRLQRTLEAMGSEDLDWQVRPVGVKVAALMTTEIIRRRLKSLDGATRVLLPGRSRVGLAALSARVRRAVRARSRRPQGPAAAFWTPRRPPRSQPP